MFPKPPVAHVLLQWRGLICLLFDYFTNLDINLITLWFFFFVSLQFSFAMTTISGQHTTYCCIFTSCYFGGHPVWNKRCYCDMAWPCSNRWQWGPSYRCVWSQIRLHFSSWHHHHSHLHIYWFIWKWSFTIFSCYCKSRYLFYLFVCLFSFSSSFFFPLLFFFIFIFFFI